MRHPRTLPLFPEAPVPGAAAAWAVASSARGAGVDPRAGAGPDTGGADAALPGPPRPEAVETLALHPGLWRADQLARPREDVTPSGHPGLDAQLPGGGWPRRALTELLLPHAGVGELRLLAPALGALQRQGRSLMWFDPPAEPCAWTLGALGVDVATLLVVRSRQRLKGPARQALPAADVLWALEHALKSGHLGAALAWLPARLPADALRRLQLAAQAHDGPVFLLRDAAERLRPSPAPLRLVLASAGPEALRVQLLKRRGPPLAQPLELPLHPVQVGMVGVPTSDPTGPPDPPAATAAGSGVRAWR